MKRIKICLLILILMIIAIVVIPNVSNATGWPSGGIPSPQIPTMEEAIEERDRLDGYIVTGDYNPADRPLTGEDMAALEIYGGKIAGLIQLIGTIVSIGALMVIGIRYMVGSAEEKAEYKERMYPYIIGAIMLFAASNLVNIIYSIFHNM